MEQPILEYFLSLKYPISIYPEEEGGYTILVIKKIFPCFLKDKKISP